MKEIDELIDKARNLAMKEVERLAKQALKQNKNLHYFKIGIGSAFFVTDEHIALYGIVHLDERPSLSKLHDFICKYNDTLKLTGEYLKIERE